MTGLYILTPMILAGLLSLIVIKIRWSRKNSRKVTTVTARNNAFR